MGTRAGRRLPDHLPYDKHEGLECRRSACNRCNDRQILAMSCAVLLNWPQVDQLSRFSIDAQNPYSLVAQIATSSSLNRPSLIPRSALLLHTFLANIPAHLLIRDAHVVRRRYM